MKPTLERSIAFYERMLMRYPQDQFIREQLARLNARAIKLENQN